jgi:hypothetical protein
MEEESQVPLSRAERKKRRQQLESRTNSLKAEYLFTKVSG